MVKGEPNSWGHAQADSYIKTADIVVVERKRLLKILIDIFRYHFGSKENLVLLDLGCGDGVLSKHIASNYPKNEFSPNEWFSSYAGEGRTEFFWSKCSL
jgi:tRNA G46 methylase TrmB